MTINSLDSLCLYHSYSTTLLCMSPTRLATSCLSALVFLPLLTWGQLDSQIAFAPARFQSSAQMVLVPVAVTDYHGKTVTGLRPQDFTILDDKTPQKIVS